jgi:hypothetical protein
VGNEAQVKHHVWCNYQNPMRPEDGAEDCDMCRNLRASYPEKPGDIHGEKLQQEHFPNVIPR